MKAGYTDQFSIGVERQLASNWGASVSYVWNDSRNQPGWVDVGEKYAERLVVLPDGKIVTVLDLVNRPDHRLFMRHPGFTPVITG